MLLKFLLSLKTIQNNLLKNVVERTSIEEKGGKDAGKFSVEIFSIRGEHVYKGEMDVEKIHECRISDLPEGCYFVKIVAGNHIESVKLIKSRE